MRAMRLCAKSVDFWVDVKLYDEAGKYLAIAWIGGDPEIGHGRDAESAALNALRSFGSQVATDLMASEGPAVS